MCAKKYRLLKEDKDVNENVDNRVNVHKELEMIDIEIYKSVMVVLLWTSILGIDALETCWIVYNLADYTLVNYIFFGDNVAPIICMFSSLGCLLFCCYMCGVGFAFSNKMYLLVMIKLHVIIGVMGNALLMCMTNNLVIDNNLIAIINNTMNNYPYSIDEISNLQNKLKCCGLYGSHDWNNTQNSFNLTQVINHTKTNACYINNEYSLGCVEQIYNLFSIIETIVSVYGFINITILILCAYILEKTGRRFENATYVRKQYEITQ